MAVETLIRTRDKWSLRLVVFLFVISTTMLLGSYYLFQEEPSNFFFFILLGMILTEFLAFYFMLSVMFTVYTFQLDHQSKELVVLTSRRTPIRVGLDQISYLEFQLYSADGESFHRRLIVHTEQDQIQLISLPSESNVVEKITSILNKRLKLPVRATKQT